MPADGVHVWRIALGDASGQRPSSSELLSRDELERANRFRFARDRRRYLASHTALRQILGGYANRHGRDLEFTFGPAGKPELAGDLGNLRFNLSHSHEVALLAVTRNRRIGVDVEWRRPLGNLDDMVGRFFSVAEQQDFAGLREAERHDAFFDCWTRKEAFIKATGVGLGADLDSFRVTINPGDPVCLLETRDDPSEAGRWRLEPVSGGEGYSGTVAVESHDWRLVQRIWPL